MLPLVPTTKTFNRNSMVYDLASGTTTTFCSYSYLRRGFNQAFPYNIDSSVYVDVGRTLKGTTDASSWAVTPSDSRFAVEATNAARSKFVEKLGQSSQFGSTLTTELASSWGTVSGSITNALLAANAVRRGQLLQAGQILGFSPPIVRKKIARTRRKGRKPIFRLYWQMPGGKLVAKSLGNKWLWYSYGVRPLIDDIHNGMDVLTRPTPSEYLEVSATRSGRDGYIGQYSNYVWIYKSSIRIRAKVRVSNPNLWLANQLGLINPVQWFLEGVKLSFVVDWFSNLSQIVNQMTDFAGLEITEPLTISKSSVIDDFSTWPRYSHEIKERTIYQRALSIPEARLVFSYERFSWQRGLNAISLLVGCLGK